MCDLVEPLAVAMKRTRKEAEEAEWHGDCKKAKRLWSQYESMKTRHLAGEQYEVHF